MNKNIQTDSVVFLRSKKTTLRPLSRADVPTLVRWINNPDIRHFIANYLPMMEAGEEKWIERLAEKRESDVVLAIEVKGKFIGTMGIHGINWKDRVCTTGAMIGENAYWGKGFGTDAKMVLLDYIFNTLNLRRVESRVYDFNKRSLDYSLHCGYKVEGRLRKQVFVNGTYVDVVLLGLFKDEWLPYWKKFMKK